MRTRTLLALIAAPLVAHGAAFAADTAPSVQHGRELVGKVGCWQCHGYQGQGGAAGPRLANTKLNAKAMTVFIRNTKKMPAYSAEVLSDADVADIHAYFQSLPAPPSPDSLPALKDLKPTG